MPSNRWKPWYIPSHQFHLGFAMASMYLYWACLAQQNTSKIISQKISCCISLCAIAIQYHRYYLISMDIFLIPLGMNDILLSSLADFFAMFRFLKAHWYRMFEPAAPSLMLPFKVSHFLWWWIMTLCSRWYWGKILKAKKVHLAEL